MTSHREIVPHAVAALVAESPEARVVLHGSVMRGTERPDSDIDLLVIRDGDDEPLSDHSRSIEGVRLCLVYYGANWLERSIDNFPYWWWPFSRSEIQRDPDGLARSLRDRARDYFRERPAISRAWQLQTQEYLRAKTDPTFLLRFRGFEPFLRHLETDLNARS